MCVSPNSATVLNSSPSRSCHPVINNARITPETQQPSVTCHSFTPKLIHTCTHTQKASIIHNCLVAAQTGTHMNSSRASRHHPSPQPTRGGPRQGHTQAANLIHTRPQTGHTQTFLWGWTNTSTHKTQVTYERTQVPFYIAPGFKNTPPSLSLHCVIIFSP